MHINETYNIANLNYWLFILSQMLNYIISQL